MILFHLASLILSPQPHSPFGDWKSVRVLNVPTFREIAEEVHRVLEDHAPLPHLGFIGIVGEEDLAFGDVLVDLALEEFFLVVFHGWDAVAKS